MENEMEMPLNAVNGSFDVVLVVVTDMEENYGIVEMSAFVV
jgi:hypothetical protein